MATEEIDKFVRKFKDLWSSGLDAHLDIDAHAGEAWIGLRVRVGGSSPRTKSNDSRTSPSRDRRRARRATVRQEQVVETVKEEKESNDLVSTEKVAIENVKVMENAKKEIVGKDSVTTEEVTVENEEEDNSMEIVNEQTAEEVEGLDDKEEHCDKTVEETNEDIRMENDATRVDNTVSEEADVNDTLVKASEATVVEEKPIKPVIEEQPAIVIVHATAVIENSTGEKLTQVECDNLQSLVFREKHLKENIVKLEFGQNSTRNLGRGKYNHTLDLKLYVSTRKLWEGPRSYVWKHLGQNEWSKGNGSTVVFNRIHVKM